ncbi:hypothetical protein AB8680_001405 [Campylobacter jejuni]|uniref:hypothetical protein n=1 Tax=Campylobacter sp. LH-2024 TaxID=3239825 RepID=UPI0012713052|nr:hypothetical protein [Campylobacter jejuni]ECK2570561.1 hypothetical protein [Campylobacter jejuni]EID8610623.1 hypothetical protein [Campylobacter jejuni]
MNKTLQEIEEEIKDYENENNRLREENDKLKQEIEIYEEENDKLYFETLDKERELLKKKNKYVFFLKNNYDRIYMWLIIIALVFIIYKFV